jgi:hypothetical protein
LHSFGVGFSKIPAQSQNLHHRGHGVTQRKTTEVISVTEVAEMP